MPQISLYVDEETMETLRADAKRSKTSISKYVSNVLHDNADRGGYPEGFFSLYGKLAGDESFRRPDDSPLSEAEPLFA